MNEAVKITPLQVLEQRKIQLRSKSKDLEFELEKKFTYLQNNIPSLMGRAVVTAVIGRSFPFIRDLLSEEDEKNIPQEQNRLAKYEFLIDKTLDIIPFFFKGFRTSLIILALKEVKKLIFSVVSLSTSNDLHP